MKKITALLLCLCLLMICATSLVACSNDQADKTGTQTPNQNGGVENGNTNSCNSNNTSVVPKPEEKSNFELICEAINENDNYLVIGTLMYDDVCLSVSDNKIIISVSADQSIRHGINPREHNDTSVKFKVTVSNDGSCEGSCVLIYEETRVVNHTIKTTTYKKSTAIFDAKITDIGDASNYRDYKIYYNNNNSFTKDSSGNVSYYDDYLSLCKEHYAEGILQLALESFYSIINEWNELNEFLSFLGTSECFL